MTPDFVIRRDDLTHPQVIGLLGQHLAGIREHSPPGSVHALDVANLRKPDVTFWTAWDEQPDNHAGADQLAGCAALRQLTPELGELKSFRTATAYLRRGVAALLLRHLINQATERGYVRVSLETGSGPAFEAAHALYLRHGFVPCGPFAGYADDPFSRCFTRAL